MGMAAGCGILLAYLHLEWEDHIVTIAAAVPLVGERHRLGLYARQSVTWMSNSAGFSSSMRLRNFSNSMALAFLSRGGTADRWLAGIRHGKRRPAVLFLTWHRLL